MGIPEAAKAYQLGSAEGTYNCPHEVDPTPSYFECIVLSHGNISPSLSHLKDCMQTMDLKWVKVLDEKQQNSSVSL